MLHCAPLCAAALLHFWPWLLLAGRSTPLVIQPLLLSKTSLICRNATARAARAGPSRRSAARASTSRTGRRQGATLSAQVSRHKPCSSCEHLSGHARKPMSRMSIICHLLWPLSTSLTPPAAGSPSATRPAPAPPQPHPCDNNGRARACRGLGSRAGTASRKCAS